LVRTAEIYDTHNMQLPTNKKTSYCLAQVSTTVHEHQMYWNTILLLKLNWNNVETPIRDDIRELVTWECKEHGVKIMNVLANPKGKCWALESEFWRLEQFYINF